MPRRKLPYFGDVHTDPDGKWRIGVKAVHEYPHAPAEASWIYLTTEIPTRDAARRLAAALNAVLDQHEQEAQP